MEATGTGFGEYDGRVSPIGQGVVADDDGYVYVDDEYALREFHAILHGSHRLMTT